jgi:predicted membrane protein
MEILLYQIGIFSAIIISSFFGKSSRNVAIILIAIFTMLQVYSSSLMVIQFLTIFIGYKVSKAFSTNKDENKGFEKDLSSRTDKKKTVNNSKLSEQDFWESQRISNSFERSAPPYRYDRYEHDPEYRKQMDADLEDTFKDIKPKNT